MDIISNNYLPGDQRLIEQIVRELKSQGIFDQFRKECISDVDTKPAYQNLRQRVESSVSGFLTKQIWNPEMNKNQVREMLRKNIYESGFLETGVERIVDQVVNPKITTVFLTKVEDVVYKFLGIEKPIKVETNTATPIKINSFHDLLPKDLEAVSPEMPEEKYMEVKDEIEDVKMEEESPSYEMLNEKKEKLVQEENSVDSSQSSVLSGIISNDSNPSQKQDSLMSLNSSESRMSLVISENTSKIEGEDVFLSQKSSESNTKVDLQMDVEAINQDAKKEFGETLNSVEEITSQNEVAADKNSEEINSRLKDTIDKKRESHHSSTERSKSKSDKDKDRSRSDKYKKEDKEPKEQKIEKEKYRIPKLSDKNKSDKLGKSKEKESKNREKTDKDVKTDRDKKSDKDKKSSKHSSERDRSKSENKSRKDSKSDKKEKEKDDKREKRDSSRNEKSKDERKSSSSSKKKESSSSKERNREKEKDSKKINEESSEKNRNGHNSSSSSSTKKDNSSSKYKKDEDKSRSSRKKDDKDDKKKKKSSKDDHYSSKEKKNGRRSSDRDSDGPPNSKILPITPQKNADKYSPKPKDSSHSNLDNTTDNAGNKDKVEEKSEESLDSLLLEMQKIKLPKFASNLQEAMKIMKIRKQLKKLENTNKLSLENFEVKKLLNDIAELSKDGKRDAREGIEHEKLDETNKVEENKESVKTFSLDINDFISSSNISMAKWNALEAKFMEEMGCVDYDSYESPYLDDEELISDEANTNFEKIENILKKVKNDKQEKFGKNIQGISHEKESVFEMKQSDLTDDERVLISEVEINSMETDENNFGSFTMIGDKYVENETEESMTTEIVISEEMIEETVLNMEDAVVNTEMIIENIEVTKKEYEEEAANNNEEAFDTSESIARNIQDTVDCVQEIVKDIEENVEILDETVFNIAETINNAIKSVKYIDTDSVDNNQIIEDTEETVHNMNRKTEKRVQNSQEIIENIEKKMEVFKNKVENNEKLNNLTHYIFDAEDSNKLNLLTVMSKQPDLVMKSVQLEEVPTQNELHSNISKPSKLSPNTDVEKTAILLQKFTKFEDCKKKAIVILEKHSLTEELIKFTRNGKHVTQVSASDNLKGDKSLKVSETEKENIEANKIIIVAKGTSTDTHTNLENEAKSIRSLDKNNITYHDSAQKIKNSADQLEVRKNENNRPIFSKSTDESIIDNCGIVKISQNNSTKIFDTLCEKSDGAEKMSTSLSGNNENLEDEEEDPCLGFEAPGTGRNLAILNCLIKSIEDNVSESIEQIKQLKYDKEQENKLHARKRKVKGDKIDISNNNLENISSKRRRTQITLKSLVPQKFKSIEENTDIVLENKFSLPLSPAESESSSERRVDVHMVSTKSRRSIQLTSSKAKNAEECSASGTVKNFKSPPKNSRGKKSTRQRYSSEDLYKPRIFLRRTRNGPSNS